MNRFSVLSTKSLHAWVVNRIEQEGITLRERNFISTEPVDDIKTRQRITELGKGRKTVVFTSAKAVEAVTRYIDTPVAWKVYCTSGNTKDLVSGFLTKQIIATADNAGKLAHEIIKDEVKEITFLCGDQRRDELPVMLEQAGIRMEEIIVYKTVLAPVKAGEAFNAVLFFSPSAVNSFFCANQLNDSCVCFAIGATTAAEIRNHYYGTVVTANEPSQESMAVALINYYKQKVQC